jgi:cytochrome c oxidase cbb3-type subunit 3
MPAWNNRLSPNEIILVSSYVASLHGQNLTSPRASEGTLKPQWTVGLKP